MHFVRHVFLSTKNCRSLASTSLVVQANLMICFSSLGGMSWVVENFKKLDHVPSLKVSFFINFEYSLQPLMFGEVI